jgi:hypothetical protein
VRQGLVKAGIVRNWVLAWLLLASVLVGALAWVVPAELVPWYYIGFIILLALPLSRLAAAPLVLAWNRHR